MFTSDKFLADAKKQHKKYGKKKPETSQGDRRGGEQSDPKQSGEEESKEIAGIRERFFSALSRLPEPMLHDLFNYYAEKYFNSETSSRDIDGTPRKGPPLPMDIAEELVPVIDLFEECYDEKTRPLPPEDWSFIRDIVSDYGDELELSTISFIMALVVDKKGFS